ncbi:MAG: NAD-dependent epimerase/dehydratase family protein [Anaerolineae bacterium]
MRVLVTGGGGFLGRYVVEQSLARGDEVTAFARSAYPELEAMGVRLVRGDLADAAAVKAACAGIDVVYHVASMTGYWGSWDAFYQANVVGTRNVIAACWANAVPRLVYTSTPSVVFGDQPHEGADESLPYPEHYENNYSRSKAIAERAVMGANGQDGLLTVSLRPHLIIGPRDRHLLPRIIARIGTGRVPQIGDGTNMVDLTYVEDAARAHLLAADALSPGSPAAGSVYFVTQGEPVNAWRWIDQLMRALGRRTVRYQVPLGAARAACGLLEFAYGALPLLGEPPATRFLANELAMSHYYDISRARHDLNYVPQFTMEEATLRTITYFREVMT